MLYSRHCSSDRLLCIHCSSDRLLCIHCSSDRLICIHCSSDRLICIHCSSDRLICIHCSTDRLLCIHCSTVAALLCTSLLSIIYMTTHLYGSSSSSSSSPHRVITLIVSIYSAYLPIYLSYSGGGGALVVGNDINLNSFLVYPLRHTGQL